LWPFLFGKEHEMNLVEIRDKLLIEESKKQQDRPSYVDGVLDFFNEAQRNAVENKIAVREG